MVSGEKILSFGLSVVLLIFALKASSFAQGKPAKVYVSHAAATDFAQDIVSGHLDVGRNVRVPGERSVFGIGDVRRRRERRTPPPFPLRSVPSRSPSSP